jgi:hypothetical protein
MIFYWIRELLRKLGWLFRLFLPVDVQKGAHPGRTRAPLSTSSC